AFSVLLLDCGRAAPIAVVLSTAFKALDEQEEKERKAKQRQKKLRASEEQRRAREGGGKGGHKGDGTVRKRGIRPSGEGGVVPFKDAGAHGEGLQECGVSEHGPQAAVSPRSGDDGGKIQKRTDDGTGAGNRRSRLGASKVWSGPQLRDSTFSAVAKGCGVSGKVEKTDSLKWAVLASNGDGGGEILVRHKIGARSRGGAAVAGNDALHDEEALRGKRMKRVNVRTMEGAASRLKGANGGASEGDVLLRRIQGWAIRLSPRRMLDTVRITEKTAKSAREALKAIHSAGFVHGDVVPRNILVKDDGTCVFVDLGKAKKGQKLREFEEEQAHLEYALR
ncbi:hypothetical protein KFL_002130010, partial [Klebsormidium nitens]